MPDKTAELLNKLKATTEKTPLSPILLNEILNDEAACRAIATAYPDIERVILQLTLDTVTEENRDVVSDLILSFRRTLNVFYLMKLKAAATPDRHS